MTSIGGLDPAFVVIVACYLLAILAIGFYGYARTTDETDYLVAGREVGPVVGGAAVSATQMSGGTFVGAIGIHYLFGVGFIWIWVGLWMGWLVSLLLVAPQMRRFGRMTVPDFVAERYGDDGAGGAYVRAVAALLIVLAHTVFLTAQVTAGGLIVQAVAEIPQRQGMIVMTAVAIGYTAFGGMRASILTDFVQAALMVTGLVVAVPLLLQATGGLAGTNAMLRSIDPELVGQSFSLPRMIGFIAASGFYIAVGPHEITRFYSMRDEGTVRQSIGIALVIQAVVAVGIAVAGLSMRVLFPELGVADLAVVVLSLDVLGPVLGALLLVAVLSAILSTIDSVMIVSGAGLAHDIYAELIDPDAGERRRVWANRIAVVVLGLLALALALNRGVLGEFVQFIIIFQLSMVGAMLFVPTVLGLHWRRATTAGGLAGMVSGFLTVVVWHVGTQVYSFVPATLARYAGDPVIPGVLVSLLLFVSVSLLTDEPSRRTLAPFFDVGAADGGAPSDDHGDER